MLAHVGSAPIEEILLVLAPVSLIAVALYLANRRADRALRARQAAAEPEATPVEAADPTD